MATEDGSGTPERDARRTPSAAHGEFELIRRLTKDLPHGRGVIVGPGDDAAVLRPGEGLDLVVTTDALVVDRHIRRDWFEDQAQYAGALGTRLAAANLSDLAAMAALPRWAVISAGIANADAPELEIMQRSLAEALARDGAALVGGNLARVEGPAWFNLTLIGEVERGRAWARRGARPGDLIAVTGSPGRAGAWERVPTLRGSPGSAQVPPVKAGAAEWARPRSRIAAARALALTNAVRAAIDISDGLHADLAQLCEASGVGAEIESSAWPHDPTVPSDEFRFGPSDDYELLLAIDPHGQPACVMTAEQAGAPLTFIGRFTAAPGTLTRIAADGSRGPLPGAGYDHFAPPTR